MVENFTKIFKNGIQRGTIFKDQSKLSPNYVPDELVHRDEEFSELARYFKPVLESGGSQRVLITGRVGVGKTALARRFGRELESRGEKEGIDLTFAHVNCRSYRSPRLVIGKLAENLSGVGVPKKGFAPQEIVEDVNDSLREEDSYLTLLLDELDNFVKRNGPDLLYSLSRAVEGSEKNRISLIATSFSRTFLYTLDEATRSSFMHNVIELDRYGEEQLSDILDRRIDLAFQPGAVKSGSLKLISKIASRSGDARFALELLWFAGKVASGKGLETVEPNHVRRAKARLEPGIRMDDLRDLEPGELLLLLALSRRLETSGAAFAPELGVYDTYGVVSEQHGRRPEDMEGFRAHVRSLEDLDLIDIEKLGGDSERRGLSIPDAPPEELEETLENILEGV